MGLHPIFGGQSPPRDLLGTHSSGSFQNFPRLQARRPEELLEPVGSSDALRPAWLVGFDGAVWDGAKMAGGPKNAPQTRRSPETARWERPAAEFSLGGEPVGLKRPPLFFRVFVQVKGEFQPQMNGAGLISMGPWWTIFIACEV